MFYPSFNSYFRFIQVLTPKKLLNFFLTYVSYYLSKIIRKPIIWHRPFTLSYEPTTKCNLGCPECPSGLKSFTRPTGNANLEEYEKIITQFKEYGIFLYLYFQGEPFIHKDFGEMIALAKKNKLYTVTSTNAHYLTPNKCEEIIHSGLDRLLISIDGTTQEVYEQYRKEGTLSKVIEGSKNMVAAKQKLNVQHPELIFQMLVVRPNEQQVNDVYRLAKEIGIDKVVLKTAQVYDYKNGNELIPTIDKYARYKQNSDDEWVIKNKLDNQCWKMWHSAVSTWDGDMLPCCFDKDANYAMGNLLQTDLHDVWENSKYNQFRHLILHSRSKIDICQNCSEGTKVWESI